jgi:hypothetical protein
MFSLSISQAQFNLVKKSSRIADSLINFTVNSEKDVASGLIEALNISVQKSCKEASSIGGFLDNEKIRVLFPDEIIHVKKACLTLGLNSLVVNFEKKLNKTAEQVSVGASDIILEQVYNLKFIDALEILNGPDNAATRYLRDNTSDDLYNLFYQNVKNEIKNTGVQKKLDIILKKYNKIPLVKKANFDLSDYITIKTIDGIFYLITEQEKEIRRNPEVRVTKLLKKIFK